MGVEAEDILRRAEVLQDHGRHDLAIPLLRKAAGLSPRSALAWARLSTSLRIARQFDEALATARRTVELRPDVSDSHTVLASAFVALELYPQAIAAGSEAVRLAPDRAFNYWPIANGYVETRRYKQAIEVCRHGMALNANQIEIRHHLGWALSGDGQAEEALSVTEAYLADTPLSETSHTVAGWSFWLLGRLEEAVSHFKHALAIDPSGDWQKAGLGIVRYDQGRWIEARALLAESIRINSVSGKARIVLKNLDSCLAQYPGPEFPISDSRAI